MALLAGILSADERMRGDQYRLEKDRNRFIIARGLLRITLGRYLATDPSQLCFVYAANGKPTLAADSHKIVHFNMSHSHDLAIFAITRDREVGVDIEQIRTDFPVGPVAERFFSAREKAMLQALPAHLKLEGFFACWSRKEACVKAVGAGLSLPLDQFDVSLIPGEPAELLANVGDPKEAQRWSLWDLPVGPAYKAALAVEGRDVQLKYWECPD